MPKFLKMLEFLKQSGVEAFAMEGDEGTKKQEHTS